MSLPISENQPTLQLSERELQVLEMVATGASNQQIARHLVISVNTVKVHLRNIFEKLGVQSRTEATRRAIQEGWVSVSENGVEVNETAAAPAKTFLITHTRLPLAQWQKIYLFFATLLALAWVVVPLMAQQGSTEAPELPVIYAQPPTPIPPAPAGAALNSWIPQAPMPTKRAGLGLAAFEGKIFAIGGVRDNNQATRLVEVYDPITNSWTEGAAKPTAAANIAGVALVDKIYVPGGCTNEGKPIDALEIYDPQTDSWDKGQTLPEARCAYGLVTVQDKLYLFGGWNGQAFADTVFVYSIKEDKWEIMPQAMPQAKGYMGAASLNETIYVSGGYDGQAEFNQTYVFRPDTGEWLEKAAMHEKRGGLGLIAVANNLYAVGGGWDHPLTTSEKYDPATDTWTTFETPFASQWRNLGLAAIDTKIYAVGGWDDTEKEYMDSVVSYQFLFQLFLPFSNSDK